MLGIFVRNHVESTSRKTSSIEQDDRKTYTRH
jgi:hypothetical protein